MTFFILSKLVPLVAVFCYVYSTGDSVTDRMRQLLSSLRHSDVVVHVASSKHLNASSQSFRLHRLVLAMNSPVLESKLYPDPNLTTESPREINLDEEPSTFEDIIKYAYSDTIEPESVISAWKLWQAAVKYSMDGLAHKTLQHIISILDATNVVLTLELSNHCNEPFIKERCFEMIQNEAQAILQAPYVYEVRDKSSMERILRLPQLNATEGQIIKAVIDWGKYKLSDRLVNGESLRRYLDPLLPLLHFDDMSPEEYLSTVDPESIFSPEETNDHLRSLLRSTIPTKRIPQPRRSVRRVHCRRWSFGRDTELAVVKVHDLTFRINDCKSVACYLTGVQVTERHILGNCLYADLPVLFTLTDHTTEEILANTIATLRHPSYTLQLPKPIAVEKNATYNVRVKLLEPVTVGNCCDKHCNNEHCSSNNYTLFGDTSYTCRRQIKFDSNCVANVKCGNVDVEFLDDNSTKFTNMRRGLIVALEFIQ